MSEENHTREKIQLLQNLRFTVEGLLNNGVSNVWNIYGGLNRLHNIMEKIFKHGCRRFDTNGEPDCWMFIQGLNWLQPSLAASPTICDYDEYHLNLPNRIVLHKDNLWLYKSLEDHSLSQKLSWLLSDKEHLLSCLEPWSFLCQQNLAEATLVCLRAVEKNEPALLTEIDPSLFLPNWNNKDCSKGTHRRSSSYPVNLYKVHKKIPNLRTEKILPSKTRIDSTVTDSKQLGMLEAIKSMTSDNAAKEEACTNKSLKPWSSFPELNDYGSENDYGHIMALKTKEKTTKIKHTLDKSIKDHISQSIELSNVIKIDYSKKKTVGATKSMESKCSTMKSKYFVRNERKAKSELDNKLKEIRISSGSSDTLNCEDFHRSTENPSHSTSNSMKIISKKPKCKTSFFIGSAPEYSGSWSLEIEGQKDLRVPKKSFIEDGGNSVLPMATGYFPIPKEGQSLMSFLSSMQFARANAELDRENAHFSISEAMIAAIEQLKYNKQLRLTDEVTDESDEEINNLKQRIRLRRRQRQEERQKGNNAGGSVGTWSRDLLSDGKTDTTTTDQSISPLSTSPGTPSESISTDDVDDYEIDDTRSLSQLKNSGLSVSMASLYSEADLFRISSKNCMESNLTDSIISAEGVALSLISRFSEKHLPRASELKWLVSEQDAPQRLLPLPKSWPVSPDDAEVSDINSISLRGTIEWAPPRPQIIFTSHPPPVRRILIAKQNYRCAGCGMKVAVEYANRFRYCEYLGRYFCTGCHTNQVNLIPGKILSKWDFNRYPVSNFSYRLLDKMTIDPLFQVGDLNPMLYRRIKQLDRTKLLRTQLFYLKDFLFTCRFATNTQEILKREPNHIISDPHIYSIQDFTQVKAGILPLELSKLVQECHKHIAECVLCQARGFICELCNSKDVIYPWELSKVRRCDRCGTCFHATCASACGVAEKVNCKKCNRLQARLKSKEELTSGPR